MLTVATPEEMRSLSEGWRADGRTVGLVPTLGALHAGHLSLVEEANRRCDKVIVSVFLNPTQFARGEDLDKYPRDLEGDRRLLASVGCDAVFSPTTEAMYGESGADLSSGARSYIEVGRLGEIWEGKDRPGHFRGVATVVSMLFHATVPHRAYFGEKDFQQLRIVEKMTRDLLIGVEVVGLPTVREPDGLAMSSRNVYLLPEGRAAAATLYRALRAGADLAAGGETDVGAITSEMQRVCDAEPLLDVKYLAVVDPDTLSPAVTLASGPGRAIVAARLGETRLIDNMEVSVHPPG